MAEGGGKREYTAIFQIGGKLLGSFKGAMMQAKSRLMELARTAKSIGGVMKGVGIAIGGMVATLGAGLVAAVAGFVASEVWGLFKKVFADAVDNAEQAADRQRTLLAYLKLDTDFRKKGNEFMENQIALLDKHNEKLATQTGMSEDIYGQVQKTMVQYGAMPHTLAEMTGPMGDFLAATKGPRASMADMAGLSDQVGNAITGGPIRQLIRMGLLEEKVNKEWSKMSQASRYKKILAGLKKFEGEAKKAMDTPLGRVVKFENSMDKLSSTVGEILMPVLGDVADMWRSVIETPAFQGAALATAKAMANTQKAIAEYVLTKVIPAFNKLGESPVWNQMTQAAAAFFNFLGDEVIKFGEEFAQMWESTLRELKVILIGLAAVSEKNFKGPLESVSAMLAEIDAKKNLLKAPEGMAPPLLAGYAPPKPVEQPAVRANLAAFMPKDIAQIEKANELARDFVTTTKTIEPLGPQGFFERWGAFGTELIEINSHIGAFVDKGLEINSKIGGSIDKGIAAPLELIKTSLAAVSGDWDGMKEHAANTGEVIKTGLTDTGEQIKLAITNPLEAAQQAWDRLKAAFSGGLTIPPVAAPAAPSLPNPPPAELGAVPHQMGGIISKPTVAMMGEKGPEAVIPLSRHTSRAKQLLEYAKGAVGAMSWRMPNREDIASMPLPYDLGAAGGPTFGTGILKSLATMAAPPAPAQTSVHFAPNITIHGNATPEDQRAMDTKLRDLARDFIEQFKAAQYQERRLSYESGYG